MQKEKVAVLGGGTMGPGIATSYALQGSLVAIYSRSQKTLERAKTVIASNLQLFVEEEVITEESAKAAFSRLTFTDSVETAVEGAWYIAETIVENPEAKKTLYEQLDAILPEDVIIASNTSYMNIFELMPEARKPYSVIAHWYAPAHILPLVEVVKGPDTQEAVMDAVMEFHKACGKTPIRMEKYIPGFIVNRMQSAMNREVYYLIENGYCTPEELDLAVKTSLMPRGMILGLVQRLDFTGLDMMANSIQNKKFTPAPELDRPSMIFDHTDKGEYGVKNGKGFFDYSQQNYEDVLRQRDKMLIESVGLADKFLKNPLHDHEKRC